MKTYTVGLVLAAILMVVTGVGFGIAQAAGTHSDAPVLSFEGDMQLSNPIETGSLPARSDVDDLDHSNVPIEGNHHQYWGSDNPSN